MDRSPTMSILATALLGHTNGLCLIPAEPDKRPFSEFAPGYSGKTWKHRQNERPEPERLERWFRDEGRKAIGIVCGKVSGGLELLEFETAEAFDEFQELARRSDLGDLLARVTNGYLERSGGGGIHLFYRSDACEGNSKLARKPCGKTLAETKGEGGFAIIAPSSGIQDHNGARYELIRGSLATIATITAEERRDLLDLARTLDRSPSPEIEDAPAEPVLSLKVGTSGVFPLTGGRWELSPLDDFNQRAPWADVLPGWTDLGEHNGLRHWRRPGKEFGLSATTGVRPDTGKDLMFCFSTSTPLPTGRGLSKAAVFAHLNCQSDFQAACRAISARGYGIPSRTDNGRRIGSDGASATDRPGSARATGEPSEDRPEILISTELHALADQAVALLASDPCVYQRGRELVHVVQDDRATGSPAIRCMTVSNVIDRLSHAAVWLKPMKKGVEPAKPPKDLAQIVIDRGTYPGVRHLDGVIEAPTLRPDGTILDRPGWDRATGLLFEPRQTFPAIPDRPTRADARQAAGSLLDLVSDFPFKDGHRAAFLAALLTPLARFAIEGPTPLFMFDANTPGAGKSMLCDIVSLVTSGRIMARAAYPEEDEEARKLIMSIALAGDRMILFDNVPTGFTVGGAALDGALTATSVKGRILGKSEMTDDIPWFCVLYATGNNLGLRGDALRRVVPCRLESPEVHPEERTDFKHPNLIDHVRRNRGELVVAALTILRAYVVAGRPEPDSALPSMDFRAWAGLIRHAIHWATGEDPCEGRNELKENDAETVALHALVAGWARLCEFFPRGVTTGNALSLIREGKPELAPLHDLMTEWSTDGGLPSSKVVGKRLAKAKGRMTPFGALSHRTESGHTLWFVRPANQPKQPKQPDEAGSSTAVGGLVGLVDGLQPPYARVDKSLSAGEAGETHPPNPSEPPNRGSAGSTTPARPVAPVTVADSDPDGWEDA